MHFIKQLSLTLLSIPLGTITVVNAAVLQGPDGMDFYNPPASIQQGKPGNFITSFNDIGGNYSVKLVTRPQCCPQN